MNKFKRIIAVLMTAAMALSLTACSDTSWIVRTDSETVPAGMYIYYQTEGYTAAGYELIQEDTQYYYYLIYGISYMDATVGDITVPEYMNQYALAMSKQYIAVNELFDELGLELSEDETAAVEQQVRTFWNNNSEQCEKVGIGKESLKKAMLSAVKREKVFDAYYEVGGINGTTEEDIKVYIEDNYARIKYMTFNFADSADDAVDEARKSEALELAQSYLDRLNAGEDADALMEEHEAELAAADEESEESEEESAAESELEEAEDGDTAEEAEAEEEDPYAYETIIAKDGEYPSEKFVNYVFTEVNTGEPKLVQDDTNIYLVYKLDILERDDFYTENYDSIISTMFDSDFTSILNKEVEALNVEVNEKSVKRYKPETAMGTDED